VFVLKMSPGSTRLPGLETIGAPAAEREQKWRTVMSVSPIKGRHQDGDEQVESREVERKEYVKRWRGFQFFLRFESHEITRIIRKPSQEVIPRPTGLHVAEALNAMPPVPGVGGSTDSEEHTSKTVMVAAGVMPPNDPGPH
jgi:hypothetical protein